MGSVWVYAEFSSFVRSFRGFVRTHSLKTASTTPCTLSWNGGIPGIVRIGTSPKTGGYPTPGPHERLRTPHEARKLRIYGKYRSRASLDNRAGDRGPSKNEPFLRGRGLFPGLRALRQAGALSAGMLPGPVSPVGSLSGSSSRFPAGVFRLESSGFRAVSA